MSGMRAYRLARTQRFHLKATRSRPSPAGFNRATRNRFSICTLSRMITAAEPISIHESAIAGSLAAQPVNFHVRAGRL